MATTVAAAATTAENPKIHSDLSLDPPTREEAASTQKPPISGAGADESKAEADAVAAKTSGVDGGSAATDIEKKMKRAERFGVAVQLSEKEKRNSRAERFGTAAPVKEVDSSKEDQKRKARAERFGTAPATAAADDDVKKKARLARFGSSAPANSVDEEKKKARAIRFSQVDSTSKSNGEGKVEGKMAVAAKAGGGT